MTNNVTDCLQNVFSKLLLSDAEYRVHPAELQFYTSMASVLLQLPLTLLVIDFTQLKKDLSGALVVYLLTNGIFFHLQSFTAYSLMKVISPVTHSVANTVKRALLITISIPIFGNAITPLSAVGMVMVVFGVMLYNQSKHCYSPVDNNKQVPSEPLRHSPDSSSDSPS
ncbi:hypothetical protein EB796_023838 [Bugula neritina]|uniref:Sugar phosphate transporter domain-containing protein n=1 Tax=Bugula neritina TaxID=10212 RepID=A0A7J7IVL1_BUGNE|nr:hypothetical protein EB796_023838 [Bugula neritina]